MMVKACFFCPRSGRALRWLGCLVAVLAGGWSPLRAQDAPPAGAPTPLSSIAAVYRTLTDPARTVAAMMRFRGTVIFTSRAGDFCLQQDESGLMIEPPDPALRPALGDLVEVEAAVAFQAADTLEPGFFSNPPRPASLVAAVCLSRSGPACPPPSMAGPQGAGWRLRAWLCSQPCKMGW